MCRTGVGRFAFSGYEDSHSVFKELRMPFFEVTGWDVSTAPLNSGVGVSKHRGRHKDETDSNGSLLDTRLDHTL